MDNLLTGSGILCDNRLDGILGAPAQELAHILLGGAQQLCHPLTVCQQTNEHSGVGMALYVIEHHGRAADLGGAHNGAACTHIAVNTGKLCGGINLHVGGYQLTGHFLQQLQGAAKIMNLHRITPNIWFSMKFGRKHRIYL